MNKKGQVVETVIGILLLFGSLIGMYKVAEDVSSFQYVGDMAAKEDADAVSCVYEITCQLKIQEIPTENRKQFDSLEESNINGYILCKCQ